MRMVPPSPSWGSALLWEAQSHRSPSADSSLLGFEAAQLMAGGILRRQRQLFLCSPLEEKIKNRNGLIFPSNSFSLFLPSPKIFLFWGDMTHFSAEPNFCKCQEFLWNRSPVFQLALSRDISNQGIRSMFSFLSYMPYASR